MQSITVLFFATLRDRAGTRLVTLDIPAGTSVARLRTLLKERSLLWMDSSSARWYPSIRNMPSVSR
jgi:molybdopterin converting factor small subunit